MKKVFKTSIKENSCQSRNKTGFFRRQLITIHQIWKEGAENENPMSFPLHLFLKKLSYFKIFWEKRILTQGGRVIKNT